MEEGWYDVQSPLPSFLLSYLAVNPILSTDFNKVLQARDQVHKCHAAMAFQTQIPYVQIKILYSKRMQPSITKLDQ